VLECSAYSIHRKKLSELLGSLNEIEKCEWMRTAICILPSSKKELLSRCLVPELFLEQQKASEAVIHISAFLDAAWKIRATWSGKRRWIAGRSISSAFSSLIQVIPDTFRAFSPGDAFDIRKAYPMPRIHLRVA
jgi:hypothetical protein